MGKFFPTATVLALLFTGSTVPLSAHAADAGALWSVPLATVPTSGVATAERLASRAFADDEHEHDDDGAPVGTVAATTDQITTDRFEVAAVSWLPDPDDVVTGIAVRVRDGGTWTDWFELGVVDDGDPAHRVASEPVIAGQGDAVQAVVETTTGRTPEDLRIDLVRAGSAPAGASKATTATGGALPAANGNELRPAIVTRAEWGANESKVRDASRSTSLKAMYVHHTAGGNTYTAEQAPGVVRAILAYHLSLGWPDIGYQFLVDQFGTIYEGRRGSLDELVVGAQAGGYNTDTIGVSGLGNFHKTGVTPTAEMERAIVQVLTWQANKWGLDTTGTVRLRTGGSTGSGTKWKVGELTDALPVIRGHQDTNWTACPGDDLYSRLGAIRAAVAAGGAPRVVPLLPAQAPVRLPATVTLKWRAVTGAVKYQVVARTAAHGKALRPKNDGWKAVQTVSTLRYVAKIPLGAHHVYGVRAVDAAGNSGPVATIGSVTRPVVSGKQLERSKGWKTVKKATHYRGRVFRTTTRGAKISLKGGKSVREVWVIAASGPGHGRIAIQVGATKVRTVSLNKAKYQPARRIRVLLPSARNGTVKITAIDQGKQVNISAVALVRS